MFVAHSYNQFLDVFWFVIQRTLGVLYVLCYKLSFHMNPKPTVCPHAVSPQYSGSMLLFFYSCELGISAMLSWVFVSPLQRAAHQSSWFLSPFVNYSNFGTCGFVKLDFYGYFLKGLILLCVYIYFCTCFLPCLYKILFCSSVREQRGILPLVAW